MSVIQLDGDIVTFVDPDYQADSTYRQRHFDKVDEELGRLLASIARLRAAVISLLAALLAAINLPGLIETFEEAAPWLVSPAVGRRDCRRGAHGQK